MNTSDESRSCAPTSLNVGETKSIASRVKFAHFGLVSFTMLSLWMGYCGTARSMSMIYSKNFENSTVAFPVEHRNQPPAATTTTTTSIKNVSVEREPTAAARTRNVIAAFIEDEAGKTTTSPASSSTELPHTCGNNSELWLRGPRYDNLHDDPYLTDDVAKHMILNIQNVLVNDNEMSAVLGQTICHADSRFLNSTQPTEKYHNDRTVRLWAVKLTYLALHYHQHRMAAPEAVARYSRVNLQCPSAFTLKQEYGVGVFDYECPDAKYIITSLSGIGLGANVRAGMVVALLVGLISDRIVIFVNNAARGVKHLKGAWPLASCPRKDYQCFFWPTTPCTLTFDEIDNAYELTRIEYRKLTKENKELKSIEHHKVWYFQLPFTPLISLPTKAAEALYKHALTLISAVSETENPQYVAFLRVAAEAIRTYDGPRAGYNYAAASLKVHHALSFYSMRPNPRMAHELDRYLTDIIPRNFTPETSVGLPIRASDKCVSESECLTFDQHMQVTSDMWQRLQQTTGISADPTVLFTTESTDMVKEQKEFVAANGDQKYPFRFNFITNTHDITPDSGFMKEVVASTKKKWNADEIMLSAMSSLKAQLMPRLSIGNCCSNFHVMLNDFLSEGCGAASDNTFRCLQESEDPLLRICCGWHHQCKKTKKELLLNMSLAAQN